MLTAYADKVLRTSNESDRVRDDVEVILTRSSKPLGKPGGSFFAGAFTPELLPELDETFCPLPFSFCQN
ncbi:MAG: hypothetical protein JWM68_5284 [Verrucomicrobiales bacterium]|nr:hypothetical protein [Verrucomicrobiales bacterium]